MLPPSPRLRRGRQGKTFAPATAGKQGRLIGSYNFLEVFSPTRSPRRPGRVNCFFAQGRLQRVSVIGAPDGFSDGEAVVVMFFLIKYQTIVASRRETSFARQFSSVSLTNKTEINFARQFFGIGLFIIAVQPKFPRYAGEMF